MAPAIPVIMVAATVIGAGVAAYSAYQSGQAQSANAKYQSAVALRNAELNKQNADFARQNAAYAEQQGAARERDAARRARAVIGATEAAAAGNGLDVGQGSPLDLREGNARIGTENIQAANENGRRTAEGFRRQAFSFENQAGSNTLQAQGYNVAGNAAAEAGYIGAGSALVSGLATAGGRYYDLERTGAFNSGLQVA